MPGAGGVLYFRALRHSGRRDEDPGPVKSQVPGPRTEQETENEHSGCRIKFADPAANPRICRFTASSKNATPLVFQWNPRTRDLHTQCAQKTGENMVRAFVRSLFFCSVGAVRRGVARNPADMVAPAPLRERGARGSSFLFTAGAVPVHRRWDQTRFARAAADGDASARPKQSSTRTARRRPANRRSRGPSDRFSRRRGDTRSAATPMGRASAADERRRSDGSDARPAVAVQTLRLRAQDLGQGRPAL